MSLDYAILGFLDQRSYTGYDLKKIFDTSVRHFWPADQSQIYRTLTRLTDNGWARMEKIEQDNRPAKKEYSITPEGRHALQEWLVTPLPFSENRSAPMIQVFFAGQLTDVQVLEMFERVAGYMRAGMADYDAIPQEIEHYQEYVQSPRDFYFWMLTLEIGKITAQANLSWLESMIQRIKTGEIPQD
jgi:PadR family transcriptional regulator AphA